MINASVDPGRLLLKGGYQNKDLVITVRDRAGDVMDLSSLNDNATAALRARVQAVVEQHLAFTPAEQRRDLTKVGLLFNARTDSVYTHIATGTQTAQEALDQMMTQGHRLASHALPTDPCIQAWKDFSNAVGAPRTVTFPSLVLPLSEEERLREEYTRMSDTTGYPKVGASTYMSIAQLPPAATHSTIDQLARKWKVSAEYWDLPAHSAHKEFCRQWYLDNTLSLGHHKAPGKPFVELEELLLEKWMREAGVRTSNVMNPVIAAVRARAATL